MALTDWAIGAGTALNAGSSVANSVLGFMNYNYQKWAQNKTWDREDNAVQRRAQDLQAAGLSKTLSAGSAAATSTPIRTTAPEIKGLGDAVTNALQGMQMKKNFAQTDAQIALLNEQARGAKIENDQKAYDYAKLQEQGLMKNAPSGEAGKVAQGLSLLSKGLGLFHDWGNSTWPKIKDWFNTINWKAPTYINSDNSGKHSKIKDFLSGKWNNLTGGVASSQAVGEDSKRVYDHWRQNANERMQEYYMNEGKRGAYGNRY